MVGTGPSCRWHSTQHYLTALRVSPATAAMLHAAASAARGPGCVTEWGVGGSCEGIGGNCSHRSWTWVWQKTQPGQLKQPHTDAPEQVLSSAAYRSPQREKRGYTMTPPPRPQNNRKFFFPIEQKSTEVFLGFILGWFGFFFLQWHARTGQSTFSSYQITVLNNLCRPIAVVILRWHVWGKECERGVWEPCKSEYR